MTQDLDANLAKLIGQLDAAIEQAIQNPLLFLDNPLLRSIDSSCAHLVEWSHSAPDFSNDSADGVSKTAAQTRVELVWQVRARSGRLQMLLDSAATFYSRCFSPAPAEGLAYGLQGDWSGHESSGHLTVDC